MTNDLRGSATQPNSFLRQKLVDGLLNISLDYARKAFALDHIIMVIFCT